MPFPPAVAQALARALLAEEDVERLERLHYADAGHGYDPFGMHPSFVTLGAGITRPLYNAWHRVQSTGHEHIPATGSAILASNHSGNIPIDGMMLWTDVLMRTDPPRVARPVADHFVPALPWVGTLFARNGTVGGSRGNVRTLLENGDILMIFPEGTPAIVKPFAQRYQLQRFRVGFAELAIRHGAPVVPVAVIGAEEQLPAPISSRRLGKLVGLPRLPIPIVPIPLPTRYHIHYGEPIPLHKEHTPADADDPDIVRAAALRVEQAVAALLKAGLKQRKGIFR